MDHMIVESVIMAFVMGGIVGAAAALCLRSSRFWGAERQDDHQLVNKPLTVRSHQRRSR